MPDRIADDYAAIAQRMKELRSDTAVQPKPEQPGSGHATCHTCASNGLNVCVCNAMPIANQVLYADVMSCYGLEQILSELFS